MHETYQQFQELYEQLKREVRERDHTLYERWKAGGFLVDSDILSMYPNIEEIAETLGWMEEDYNYEDEEEENP
jgi:hypothetical protein